jgi:subtilisin family serine protease
VVFATPAGWQGQCQAGEGFATTDCNNKLIGARYYIDGFLDQYTLDDNEFISPKDADGHGTHIASVAAGNRSAQRWAASSSTRSAVWRRGRMSPHTRPAGWSRASCAAPAVPRT